MKYNNNFSGGEHIKSLFLVGALAYGVLAINACRKSDAEFVMPESSIAIEQTEKALLTINSPDFVKGADVSHVTRMEDEGKFFYNTTEQEDLFTIMKERGINTIRLRVWVNSLGSYYYSSLDDVLAKALRAKDAGMKLFIDFHYSDTWADPWNQYKPDAWASYSLNDLKIAVANHTANTINTLVANGVVPTYVQIGNETDDGMLWPTGQISAGNMANFAVLYKAGYDAVKTIDPAIQVMVQFSRGFDNDSCKAVLDGLLAQGAAFDVIGLSVYPSAENFDTIIDQTNANMQDLAVVYGKHIMVAECGYLQSEPVTTRQMITTLLNDVNNLPDGLGIGVCYWEPQYYDRPPVNKSMFSSTDKNPTVAIDAFSMVRNPGFEVDAMGTQTPADWITTGSNPEADYVEANGHTGSYRLTHWSNGVYDVSTSQTITGLSNGKYTFRAWVISPYALTSNYIFARDFGSDQIEQHITPINSWQQISITDINVTNGECTIGFHTSGDKYCSFDDVVFFKQ